MKIALGADHGGFALKEKLKDFLENRGDEVLDFGTHAEDSCDYPIFGFAVAEAVSNGEAERGVLVCTTGAGMAIVANKVKGIRAAVCHDAKTAQASRAHNDANIITFGQKLIGEEEARGILDLWLKTAFEGGRHARRVGEIEDYEKKT